MLRFQNALLIALMLTITGCSKGKKKVAGSDGGDSRIPNVRAVVAKKGDLTKSIEVPGSIEGYETADLYAKVGGFLKEVKVDIGDVIKKDQELAVLSIPEMAKIIARKEAGVTEAKAKKKQAEAMVKQITAETQRAEAALREAKSYEQEVKAQLNYASTLRDRMRALVNSGGAKRERYDEANFQYQKARSGITTAQARTRTAEAEVKAVAAQMDKAKADITAADAHITAMERDVDESKEMAKYGVIRAPFDGVVTMRHLHPGAFVQPAERNSAAKPLLTVTRNDRLRIFVSIPMSDVRWLDKTDTASLKVEGHDEKITAYVARFSPTLDSSSRTMRVELSLDKPKTKGEPMLPSPEELKEEANKHPKIFPGSYVYVTLELIRYEDVIVVPSSAVLTDSSGKFVYLIESNKIKKQSVKTVFEDGKKVGISKGLEGGETIVETGGGQLAPGQEVKATTAMAK